MKKYDIVDYKNEDGVISPYEVLFTFHIKEEKVDCAVIFPKGGNGHTDLEIVTYKYENEKLILGTPTGDFVWKRIDEEIEMYFQLYG